MSTAESFQLISTVCAVLAAGCAMLAAHRAGKWRESEAAQHLVAKVQSIKDQGDRNASAIERVERETTLKLLAIKEEIDDLATKEDVAKVRGAVDRVCAIADRTEAGVTRLQDFLMSGGKA